ncbi:MAG TPA: hypothetical protein VJN02_07735 [Gammaproteobacteria bacterium]|nr:hypothetical protein [Gammaproteobacteria bacterium]
MEARKPRQIEKSDEAEITFQTKVISEFNDFLKLIDPNILQSPQQAAKLIRELEAKLSDLGGDFIRNMMTIDPKLFAKQISWQNNDNLIFFVVALHSAMKEKLNIEGTKSDLNSKSYKDALNIERWTSQLANSACIYYQSKYNQKFSSKSDHYKKYKTICLNALGIDLSKLSVNIPTTEPPKVKESSGIFSFFNTIAAALTKQSNTKTSDNEKEKKESIIFSEKTAEKTASALNTHGQFGNAGTDDGYLLKIAVLGTHGAGKTDLILRFADDTYTDSDIHTLGVDFKTKSLAFEKYHGNEKNSSGIVKLKIWDQDYNENQQYGYNNGHDCRGVSCIILAVDMTDKEWKNNIKGYIQEIDLYASPNTSIVLVGTKSDAEDVFITEEEIKEFAENQNLPYVITSAKNNTNVNEAFYKVCEQALLEKMKPVKSPIFQPQDNKH